LTYISKSTNVYPLSLKYETEHNYNKNKGKINDEKLNEKGNNSNICKELMLFKQDLEKANFEVI